MRTLSFFILAAVLAQRCDSSVQNTVSGTAVSEGTGEWCQTWKHMICASDGNTYWNECLFLKKRAKIPGLEIVSTGACEPVECEHCVQESAGLPELHLCTSSNMLLSSTCMFECLKEEYPLATEDYYGCQSTYPSVQEMEKASPAVFSKIVEQFLTRALPPGGSQQVATPMLAPAAKRGDRQRMSLTPFQGFIQHNNSMYKVNAKRGWMQDVSWVSTPESYFFSSEKPGRMMFRLTTGSLETGYDSFVMTSGRARSKTSMAVRVMNATLMLVADAIADRHNCTRVRPTEVRLIELPAVELLTAREITLAENIPGHELEGFIKEKFVRKINEAIESSLYTRMHRVGCLSWEEQASSPQDQCFGAFQTRYCSSLAIVSVVQAIVK